ncbi:Metalloendopeptidase [Meloidogyne graminicola]|uniref:Metalloendopeptidase n=1 Tax=Meloidogyne graminicola TaxID=189291 RepID=A0A8S9ZUF5_9BILA|nr:Metalloendopeptidase [Meloidogyne graminicola]
MDLFSYLINIDNIVVNQQNKLNFYYLLNLIILIIFINFNDANQFFDKTIPDGETILTQADFQRFQQRQKRETNNENNSTKQNIDDSAMYNKERFEGDILTAVTPVAPSLSSIKNTINEETSEKTLNNVQRNAVRQSFLKWPKGRIPYTVSTQYTNYGRERVAEAIDEYHKKTCVEWTPKTANDIDYVHILPDDGCYSLVGKVGGKQPVSLGEGCMTIGIVIHELMHSVGFFHEQSRTDRDGYVNILWENIDPTLRGVFNKINLIKRVKFY